MTLNDFLLPSENIKFSSKDGIVEYADKRYRVFVTDKRLILYAHRGMLIKSNDIISEKLDVLYGLKYFERGTIFRSAVISVQGSIKFEIRGSPSTIKPLFHSLQAVVH